jgi:hypothetical protein
LTYKESSTKEIAMIEKFKCEVSRDAADEAIIASRIKASAVVTKMIREGTRWTLTAKPESAK